MTTSLADASAPVIMVVEDERITALDLKRRLESFGYRVPPIASTGAEALLRAAETRPDLVLMDIMLKGPIDGITAAQQIRVTYDIPSVYLTAYSDDGMIERAKETQPLGYLLKPFEERSLRSTIEIALANRALQRSLRDELRARQEAQAALQESERQLRLIAENTTDLIMAYDMDRRLVYVNPAIERMTGYSISELHTMQMLVTHPNDEALMQRLWDKIFDGQPFSDVESRIITKDGRFIWVQAAWGPLYDEAGRQIGVRGAIRDITEHKRAEQLQALQLAVTRITAEARSRAEAAPRLLQAICINAGWQIGELWRVDPDTMMLCWESTWHMSSVNAAAFVAAGHTASSSSGEVVGQCWATDQFVWATAIDTAAFERAGLAAAAGLRDAIALPVRAGTVLAILAFYHHDIPQHDLDLRTTLESVSSQIGQFFERMRAEEQLRQYAQQLMEAQEQERARIARELHDEIGQALALIKMNVRAVQRLAQTTELAPRLGQSLGIIEETLQRVRSLALDLRPSMLDDLGLAATLQWYVERQGEWADWNVAVNAALDSARLPRDMETACFRIAQEALNNVARHAQAQTVQVDLWQDATTLHMQIHDDGQGFDVRVAQERAARGGSAGLLGMRERVALAGGQLTIESAPGQGTLLWVRLPLADSVLADPMASKGD